MEPSIRYAKTRDGVSIAYWTMGEGYPLLLVPPVPFGHIQVELEIPLMRAWYQRLAQNRMVIRYDTRGTGLSQRNIAGFSREAALADIDAVVDALNLPQLALFTYSTAGPGVLAYAAKYPERVTDIVLFCTYASAADFVTSPQVAGSIGLIAHDWTLFTETVPRVAFGWSEQDAGAFARLIRDAVTPDAIGMFISTLYQLDAAPLLASVKSRTLVLHRRDAPFPSASVATGLAARIPGAQLALLGGEAVAPYLGDADSVTTAIEEFLAYHDATDRATAGSPEPGSFRTVLFTDIVGHTPMMQRLGDEKGRVVLRDLERVTREVLKAHGGAEVKTMGDGFMASFGSVTKAVECAIALQRAFAERNDGALEPLHVRAGLNAGEPVVEDSDLFGSTVILAARIAAAAQGGEVLASMAVRELCAGKGFLFADRGEYALRGFEDPVRMFEVSWRE
jgi:class 3 adenylate cyclase